MRRYLIVMLCYMFSVTAHAQTKYLKPETASALGISGGFAQAGSNSQSYGFSLGNRAKEWLEFGCGLSNGKIKNDGEPNDSYTAISPYVQLIGMHDSKRPLSASLTLLYLRYVSSTEPMPKKNFGFDATLFRDISFSRSSLSGLAIVPEVGLSKIITFDKGYGDNGATVSAQITLIFNHHKRVEFLISPSISKNKGDVAKAISGGIVFERQ